MIDFYRDMYDGAAMLYDADQKIGHVWKMPTPYDSIQFAFTETAEVVNDRINQQQAGYARNNFQRSPNIVKELTDVGMMLLKYFLSSLDMDMKTVGDVLMAATNRIVKDNKLLITIKRNAESTWIWFLKEVVENPVSSDISKIAAIVAYAMTMIESYGTATHPGIQTLVAAALFLIAGHELFAEKSFVEYLKEKLVQTEEKVITRSMNIV